MSTPFPLPEIDWEPLRPFWAAAAEQRLEIPRCSTCHRWNWYPPERCRSCDGESLVWTAVSGRATLFSWAVVRRALAPGFADQVPYLTGIVTLAEDPAVRLVTRFVDCEPEDLRVDLPMQVVFRPLRYEDVEGEVVGPLFAPAV